MDGLGSPRRTSRIALLSYVALMSAFLAVLALFSLKTASAAMPAPAAERPMALQWVASMSNLSVPPGSVAIDGPTLGRPRIAQRFTTTVGPISATLPITYVWHATGLPPLTHVMNALTDTAIFQWNTPGAMTVTAEASNTAGTVSGTHHIDLAIRPESVVLAGPVTGRIAITYHFTTSVGPVTTTLPITFAWTATGLPPVTHTVSSLTDSADFAWPGRGLKTVRVTATNATGIVAGAHEVLIPYIRYMPSVSRR